MYSYAYINNIHCWYVLYIHNSMTNISRHYTHVYDEIEDGKFN